MDGPVIAGPDPGDGVAAALAHLERAEPRLHGAHLICVDGPSGAGKTTFAAGLLARRPDARVLHLDALMEGWDGLGDVAATLVRDVLTPLAAGEIAVWRRYSWVLGVLTERVALTVPPGGLLVVEGVGSGDRVTAPWRSALAWLEAPADVRRPRALARPEDGEAFAPRWDAWARQETAHHLAQDTRRAADLVLTTG